MTDLPQSGDGPPAVAALATHVNTLRRDLKSLTAKVDVLTSTQQEWHHPDRPPIFGPGPPLPAAPVGTQGRWPRG